MLWFLYFSSLAAILFYKMYFGLMALGSILLTMSLILFVVLESVCCGMKIITLFCIFHLAISFTVSNCKYIFHIVSLDQYQEQCQSLSSESIPG